MQPSTALPFSIDDIMENYSLALNGHFDSQRPLSVKTLSRFQQHQLRSNLESLGRFLERFQTSESNDLPTVSVGTCKGCGLSITAAIDADHKTLRYHHSIGYDGVRGVEITNSCGYSAPAPYRTEMHIPSGKVIIANDLRRIVFPGDNSLHAQEAAYSVAKRGYDILTNYGSRDALRLHHEFWRDKGLSFIPAGNTFVSVLRDTTSQGLDFQRGDMGTSTNTVMGEIDTALWAVCAMDMHLFKRYCEAFDINAYEWATGHDALVVDISPGRYQLTLLNDGVDPEDYAALIATMRPIPNTAS